MKRVKEMNEIEKIAYRNVKGIFSWNVGGWFNSWQDGYVEDIPTLEEAMQSVYDDAMENSAAPGHYSVGRAPREMRFAGTEFIKECVRHLFQTDEDVKMLQAEGFMK